MADTGTSADAKLTRYLILSSSDEGRTAAFIGEQLAPSSEQALRGHFQDPPRDTEDDQWYAAVSENSLRWRKVKATVRTSISEVKPAIEERATAQSELPTN